MGEPSGRPARGPSPFVATRHFPRTAGESSPPPRPDSLVVTAGVVRARRPFLPGGSLRSQRYIRFAPRVRVSAGWYALTVPGAAQRCGTSFQRLVCGDPPVRKCLRISESVRAFGAHICGAGRSPGEVFSGDQPPPCLLPRTAGKSSLILAVLGDFALLRLASPTVDAHADLRSADRGSLPTGR